MQTMTIKTDYSKAFSYARMQNGIPAVRSVTLRNTGKEALSDVRLSIDFDPPFSARYEAVLSEVPKGKTILDSVKVLPSATFLANLTERMEGTMTVALESKDGTESEKYPVALLPYDFWEGINDAPELLSAYVLPNHPAIRPILQRASEKLQAWTGSPSLDGYQSGDPCRAKMQMAAIYLAIAEERISYANPPASFAGQGQRVRLPEDILSGRLATCLDAALLYAGCMEAAGLRPLLVIQEGHAYAGAWIVEKSSPYPVNDDPAILRKSGADGINELVLVETTGFLNGHERSFEEAVSIASGSISDVDSFLLFIDVCSARNLGIRPIPQRILTPEGYVIDEETVSGTDIPGRMEEADDINLDRPAKVGKHTIWERKLLDLTLRNNLINIHSKKGVLQLIGAGTEEAMKMLEDGEGFNIFGIPQGSILAGDRYGLDGVVIFQRHGFNGLNAATKQYVSKLNLLKDDGDIKVYSPSRRSLEIVIVYSYSASHSKDEALKVFDRVLNLARHYSVKRLGMNGLELADEVKVPFGEGRGMMNLVKDVMDRFETITFSEICFIDPGGALSK